MNSQDEQLIAFPCILSVSDLGFWIMKNRQTNPHLEINPPEIYCLQEDRVGILLADPVLTSVLSPPTNVTVKYNNTLRQNNFQSIGSSNTAVPTHPFWIVVGFCCYIRFCVIRANHGVRKKVLKSNRYNVYLLFYICEKHETSS